MICYYILSSDTSLSHAKSCFRANKKAPETRKVPEIPVLLCILSLCIFFQYIEYFVVFSRFNHNIWVLRVLLYEPPRQKSRVNPKTARIIFRLFSSSMLGHPLNVLKIPPHTLLSLTNPHVPCYSQNRQNRQKSAKTVLQTLQQVRGGVVAHTHAWQVNILTTGSICEIQICPAGTIVWLTLINETHVRFFTVQEVSFL